MTYQDDPKATWRKDLADWPAFGPRVTLDAARTALVLVDMQNGYVSPKSEMAAYLRRSYPRLAEYYLRRQQDVAVPNLQRLLAACRARGMRVVYVTFAAHLPDSADWLPSRRAVEERIVSETGYSTAVLRLGTWEADVIDELRPEPGELVLNKVTRSAFTSTGIDQVLRNMRVEFLVVGGCITNVCVETTVRDAVDRAYQCVVVEDACASFNPRFHEASVRALAGNFAAVRSTQEVLDELGAPAPEVAAARVGRTSPGT